METHGGMYRNMASKKPTTLAREILRKHMPSSDAAILTIEGLLSVKESDTQKRLEVIVKTGPKSYKKHYLGLSDNVTYFVEQLEPVTADPFHYRVIFRPTTIIPDMELQVR